MLKGPGWQLKLIGAGVFAVGAAVDAYGIMQLEHSQIIIDNPREAARLYCNCGIFGIGPD
jgi:hypothetical protein